MKTPLDARTRLELARFRLAFTCERCAQFDEPRGLCSLGYPNDDHREAPLEGREALVFCKEFELW